MAILASSAFRDSRRTLSTARSALERTPQSYRLPLKYRPGYPGKGFKSLDEVRQWVMKFVRWYNTTHRHSALKFVTPAQRH
ncbi:MAG: transposase [Ignavibacteria bacterium]|nr:transposase [Ignavibacteria bacterium]